MLRGIFQKLGEALSGRKLDESLLEDWEEQLIMSDVSISTTQHLLSRLREAARKGQASDDEAALDLLKSEAIALLGEETTPLTYAPDGLTVWLIAGVNGVGKPPPPVKLPPGFSLILSLIHI